MTIFEHVSLAPYTTFRVGGEARYFCSVGNIEDLKFALDFARTKGLRVFVLGGGSNVVIGDAGFDGLVIKMEIKGVERTGDLVCAYAGEVWDDLVSQTVLWGMWGLENLSLIPGTVGAAPVQNIGAYGVEAKDSIHSVETVEITTGKVRTFTNAECLFSYRDSFFKSTAGKNLVIVSVTFHLSDLPRPNLEYRDLKEFFANVDSSNMPSQTQIRDAVISIRRKKFPDLSQIGTAGSFWKNPIMPKASYEALKIKYPGMPSFSVDQDHVKVPLAWILDNLCHLKGYARGNVGLFEKQPLVLVAKRGSTAKEIKDFETEVRALVKEKIALDIEPEVGFLC